MEVTPEQREQIRLSLLRYGLSAAGYTAGLAKVYLRAEGWRQITEDEVQAQIDHLAHAQKGFLDGSAKAISPEVVVYRTTPNGQDYLAKMKEERT